MNMMSIRAHIHRASTGSGNADHPSRTRSRAARCSRPGCRTAAVLLALLGVLPSSRAALLTYDGFNYNLPSSIDGENGGVNWTTSWGQFFGDPTTYGMTNLALNDPSGLLYTTTNSVYTTGGFTGRFFLRPGTWALAGTTNYFSVLIRPNTTPAVTNFYGLQIFSDNNNTGNGVDLFVGKNGDGPNWGLQAGEGTNAFSSVPATLNHTALLVVRVVFYEGAPDVFNLYVNPTPGNPEPATPDAVITNDIGHQDGIALSTGNAGAASFAHIRIGSTFASVTPTTSTLDPNIVAYEPFDYGQGNPTLLDSQNGGFGWDNVNWGQGLGGASNYTIGAASLSDPSGLLVTSGNRITCTNNGDAGRFNSFPNYATPGSTVYWSFLVRPENAPDPTNYYGLIIYASAGDNGLLVGKNGSGPNWGLEAGAGNDAYSSVACTMSQTAFLVVRGDFGTDNDTFRLYVNPTPGAPEPATADATISDFIGTQNGISFTTGNGGVASYDEIRIGTNYADVTPAVSIVVTNPFNITSIIRSGNNIMLTWNTTAGNTNAVQATNGSSGNYSTLGFTNISAQMVIPGTPGSATTWSFTDTNGATNKPARYYRIWQVP
ncbi:MAG TPA: hypothetical protein VMV72_17490 [Verrucomicrobiae bacterium]|nr:hypothetical protein [Verrucomicrobiae bacterium]